MLQNWSHSFWSSLYKDSFTIHLRLAQPTDWITGHSFVVKSIVPFYRYSILVFFVCVFFLVVVAVVVLGEGGCWYGSSGFLLCFESESLRLCDQADLTEIHLSLSPSARIKATPMPGPLVFSLSIYQIMDIWIASSG